MKKSILLFFFLLESFALRVWGQCPANFPTALPTGSCTAGTRLPEGGTTINNNETYYFSAANIGSPYNGVTIADGGTLRICGTLELNTLTMNAGSGAKLIIEAGAKLTVLSTANLNGGNLTVYGKLVFRDSSAASSLIINNDLYAATDSAVVFQNATTQVNGNLFIRRNTTAKTLQINSQGRMCLGPLATLTANSLINDANNPITVVSGNACLRINNGGTMTTNSSLTTSAALKVCLGSSVTEAGQQYGAAMVLRGCVSCQVALPVELTAASARQQGQTVAVNWVTASERNSAYFVVEKATNEFQFTGASERITARGNSQDRTPYNWTDSRAVPGWNYYRLRQVDLDGTTVYSRPMSVAFRPERTTVIVTPNPADGNFRVRIMNPDEREVRVRVTTLAGRAVLSESVFQGLFSERIIDLGNQPNGLYLLHVGSQDDWQRIKLIKVGH